MIIPTFYISKVNMWYLLFVIVIYRKTEVVSILNFAKLSFVVLIFDIISRYIIVILIFKWKCLKAIWDQSLPPSLIVLSVSCLSWVLKLSLSMTKYKWSSRHLPLSATFCHLYVPTPLFIGLLWSQVLTEGEMTVLCSHWQEPHWGWERGQESHSAHSRCWRGRSSKILSWINTLLSKQHKNTKLVVAKKEKNRKGQTLSWCDLYITSISFLNNFFINLTHNIIF